MPSVTGTIRVKTLSDGTKIVGVKYANPDPPPTYLTKWFPAAGTHIIDAMKGHPGVEVTVTYSSEGDPPQDVPSDCVVG